MTSETKFWGTGVGIEGKCKCASAIASRQDAHEQRTLPSNKHQTNNAVVLISFRAQSAT
jgi:hypothetical protein